MVNERLIVFGMEGILYIRHLNDDCDDIKCKYSFGILKDEFTKNKYEM